MFDTLSLDSPKLATSRTEPENERRITLRRLLTIGSLIALLTAAIIFRGPIVGAYAQLTYWIDGLGAGAPAAFIAVYIVATCLSLPVAPLIMASGLLFGFMGGSLWTWLASSIAAVACFLISRYLFRDALERRLASSSLFDAVQQATHDSGLKMVALLRMSPFLPSGLLSYTLGLTRARLWHQLAACLVTLPACMFYAYSGSLLSELAAVASGEAAAKEGFYYLLLALGALAGLGAMALITRKTRAALDAKVTPQ